MRGLDEFKKISDTNLDKLDLSKESKLRLIDAVKSTRKINFGRLRLMFIPTVAAVIAFIILLSGVFLKNGTLEVYGDDLMKGITPQKVVTVELSKQFIQATVDFSIDLFKNAYTKNKNSLVSPISVYLALGMTANGSDDKTLKEFETLLGKPGINIKELNAYYNSLLSKLSNGKSGNVSIANSIWYNKDESFNFRKDFLQTNANYYNASAFKADFTSKQTIQEINKWVKVNTGKQIDKIIDKIDGNIVMYLINATYFDAQWKKPYDKANVHKSSFELADGTNRSVDFMYSDELGYLKGDKSRGFIKPYKDGKYSFVALLPDEGVNIDSYVESLSGEIFINLLKSKSEEHVTAGLPIFKSEYNVKLVEPLKHMGLKECFDAEKANFSRMTSTKNNIFVSNVLHKTFISVDTQGTKAGAVTTVRMAGSAAPKTKSIILNRPFVYAIVDNETKLPLFIGTLMVP